MNATNHYDVILIGTGAGGGTLAQKLAPSGKRILLLERGDWLAREPQNWDVHDVFVDGRYISPDTWYDADTAKAFQPQVVCLSGFLTLAFDSMKETVEVIKKAGLRNKVKIMIGGGQIDETVRAYTGADAFGVNAVEAVKLCKTWMGEAA